tara:strand:+ start:239 stop:490 length:252 start_codon:yes stop_codon:yes gene_type:complete
MTKQIKNKYHEDYRRRSEEAMIKKFLDAVSIADKRQGKEDLDFLTSIIIATLTEEEVVKHIPEESQKLLRKKLVSLMDKKLGL